MDIVIVLLGYCLPNVCNMLRHVITCNYLGHRICDVFSDVIASLHVLEEILMTYDMLYVIGMFCLSLYYRRITNLILFRNL